jgi:hypothetical protein
LRSGKLLLSTVGVVAVWVVRLLVLGVRCRGGNRAGFVVRFLRAGGGM